MATITIKERIIKVMRILRSRFIRANQSLHKQRNLTSYYVQVKTLKKTLKSRSASAKRAYNKQPNICVS